MNDSNFYRKTLKFNLRLFSDLRFRRYFYGGNAYSETSFAAR